MLRLRELIVGPHSDDRTAPTGSTFQPRLIYRPVQRLSVLYVSEAFESATKNSVLPGMFMTVVHYENNRVSAFPGYSASESICRGLMDMTMMMGNNGALRRVRF